MIKRINTLYFSPTNTTKKVVSQLAEKIAEEYGSETPINKVDFTLPGARKNGKSYTDGDLVIVGVPVYAGRVPNILLNYLNSLQGNGALAISVVVYGNRNFDDALIELRDILEVDGFQVIAAGAFIGEHSFSKILAQNRPDEKDLEVVNNFAQQIVTKLTLKKIVETIMVKGQKPYRKYYMPKDHNGNPVDIRKVKPKTNNECTNCKHCVEVCPMGSIDFEDVAQVNGICIKCGACIKGCPNHAKYYDDSDYLRHKYELEIEYAHRQEPELFV